MSCPHKDALMQLLKDAGVHDPVAKHLNETLSIATIQDFYFYVN